MKLILKVFLIFVLFQTLIVIVKDYLHPSYSIIINMLLYILQILYLVKVYLKTYTEIDKKYTIKQIKDILIFSTSIFICYSISEFGFTSLLLPGYVQDYPMEFLTIVGATIFGPISEELIFRGILLNKLKKRYSFLLSNIIQALVFSLLHFNMYILIITFSFGILLGIVSKYKNIYCCIIIHSLNNILAIISIIYSLNFSISKIVSITLGLSFGLITIMIIFRLYKNADINKVIE